MEKLKDYHFKVSLIKSIVRIVGFICLPFTLILGAIILIIAEILGICEEL